MAANRGRVASSVPETDVVDPSDYPNASKIGWGFRSLGTKIRTKSRWAEGAARRGRGEAGENSLVGESGMSLLIYYSI